MKFLLLLPLVALGLPSSRVRVAPEDYAEPPLGLVLVLGEDRYELEVDETIEVTVGDRKLPATIRSKPTRRFDFEGLAFDYPSHLAYSVDTSTPGILSWSLDGADCIVMVQRYPDISDPEDLLELFVETMVDQFGSAVDSEEEIELELLGEATEGVALTIEFAGTFLLQEIFAFRAGDASWVLVVQDSLDDEGENTEEMLEVREVVAESMQESF